MRKLDFKLNYIRAIFTFFDTHAEKLENVSSGDDDHNDIGVRVEKWIEFVLFVLNFPIVRFMRKHKKRPIDSQWHWVVCVGL